MGGKLGDLAAKEDKLWMHWLAKATEPGQHLFYAILRVLGKRLQIIVVTGPSFDRFWLPSRPLVSAPV
jgi:hypothetical protein